jgi:outer membrane protein TolC
MNTVQNQLESDLSETNLKINDTLLYISKVKLDHGNITEYDYGQIELQALNNRYELDHAVKNYDESKQQLCTFLGIEPDNYRIAIPDFNMPLFMDMDLVLSYARRNNTFYTEKQIEEMEAEKSLFSTKISSNLNGNINLSYGMNQFANKFIDAYRNGNTRGGVSIGLEIPIFQWGLNKNNVRIAENSHDITLLSIEKSISDFESDIRERINTYNHSVSLWITAEKAYALSREQYRILVHKFSLEKVSIFELTSAQKEQNDAMKRYYAAIKDVYTNYYALREITLYDFIKDQELEYTIIE